MGVAGGKVEQGESVEDAAKRELKEELGVEVEVGKQIGIKWFDLYEFKEVSKLESISLSPNMKNLKKILSS